MSKVFYMKDRKAKKVKISRFVYLCHVEMASRLCHTSGRIMRASAKLYLQITENFLQIYEDCDVKHCLVYVFLRTSTNTYQIRRRQRGNCSFYLYRKFFQLSIIYTYIHACFMLHAIRRFFSFFCSNFKGKLQQTSIR